MLARTRSVLAALAAALLVAAGVAAGAAPASAAPSCTARAGVLVVVDFGSLGGGVQSRCVPSVPGSGYDALAAARFAPVGTAKYGKDVICRVANKPSPQAESCSDTPSAKAYWSYWHGDPKANAWRASTKGAGSAKPRAGRVEGWSFGGGTKPATSVAAALSDAKPPPRAASNQAPDSGFPTLPVVLIVVVVVLVAMAATVAWRRRRTSGR